MKKTIFGIVTAALVAVGVWHLDARDGGGPLGNIYAKDALITDFGDSGDPSGKIYAKGALLAPLDDHEDDDEDEITTGKPGSIYAKQALLAPTPDDFGDDSDVVVVSEWKRVERKEPTVIETKSVSVPKKVKKLKKMVVEIGKKKLRVELREVKIGGNSSVIYAKRSLLASGDPAGTIYAKTAFIACPKEPGDPWTDREVEAETKGEKNPSIFVDQAFVVDEKLQERFEVIIIADEVSPDLLKAAGGSGVGTIYAKQAL